MKNLFIVLGGMAMVGAAAFAVHSLRADGDESKPDQGGRQDKEASKDDPVTLIKLASKSVGRDFDATMQTGGKSRLESYGFAFLMQNSTDKEIYKVKGSVAIRNKHGDLLKRVSVFASKIPASKAFVAAPILSVPVKDSDADKELQRASLGDLVCDWTLESITFGNTDEIEASQAEKRAKAEKKAEEQMEERSRKYSEMLTVEKWWIVGMGNEWSNNGDYQLNFTATLKNNTKRCISSFNAKLDLTIGGFRIPTMVMRSWSIGPGETYDSTTMIVNIKEKDFPRLKEILNDKNAQIAQAWKVNSIDFR